MASFPPVDPSNPYLSRFRDALEGDGVTFSPSHPLTPSWARSRPVDVVHLHWLEHIVRRPSAPGLTGPLTYAKAGRFLATLAALRNAGVRVVWTVHNLTPHEPMYPWLDGLVARRVARQADGLIVHSEYAAGRVAERLGRADDVWVVPHPSYAGGYPPASVSREEVRRDYGFPDDAFVFLVFGKIRPYKRVPEVIAAFRRLADPDARLLVAGGGLSDREIDDVHGALGGDRRIVVEPRFVADERVEALHLASDAAVIGYREVFSSGALLLALTFGVPVVVPAGGTAAEVAPPPATEPFDEGRLVDALAAIRDSDPARRRAAALAAAARVPVESVAQGVLAAYEGRPWAGVA